jgi:UDP-N-acetylenolpyruvoylglucosamine reductase
VIVNLGGARAADVLELMTLMRDSVRDRFGVTLTPEVEFLGLEWK